MSTTDQIKAALKEKLTLEISNGFWTEPNDRVVKVIFDGEVICQATFNVVQKREYEG